MREYVYQDPHKINLYLHQCYLNNKFQLKFALQIMRRIKTKCSFPGCNFWIWHHNRYIHHLKTVHAAHTRGFRCGYDNCDIVLKNISFLEDHIIKSHKKKNTGTPAIVTVRPIQCQQASCNGFKAETPNSMLNHLKLDHSYENM